MSRSGFEHKQQPMSIEKRMELLESRFTTPSSNAGGTSSAPSSPLDQASPTASHHSFNFDAPVSRHAAGASNHSASASNLDKALVRPKRRSPRPSSLDVVQLAAQRQMERVASSPLMGFENHSKTASNISALASPGISNASLSNQTLLTSHLNRPIASTVEPVKVVAESPPTLVSPALQPGMPMAHKPRAVRPPGASNHQHDKRKSVPVKRPAPSVRQKSSKRNNVTPSTGNSRKRTRLNFDTGAPSPPKATSDERSNPTSRKSRGSDHPPANNSLIDDFFSVATKQQKKIPLELANKTEAEKPAATYSSDSVTELQKLRQRCSDLERMVHEKESQLKAVSNNQTMLHATLQNSLRQREKELKEVEERSKRRQERASRQIETLVRERSLREATELQANLAADSARLGRIVTKRSAAPLAMHQRWTEEWEKGTASQELTKREKKLMGDLRELEKQLTEAQAAAATFLANGKPVTYSGGVLTDHLGGVEAEQSIQMRLARLRAQERELQDEKRTLEAETALHLRALKRDQYEKESRFNDHPKLNDRYVLLSLLGKGGFSEVWRAYDRTDHVEVAVKIHQLDSRWSDSKKDNYTKHVSREYEIHRDVRHPRIVSLLDVFEIDNNSFATVLEVCKGTDLDTMLKSKKRLPEPEARAILLQILSGMQYLCTPSGNRQGIIHYDLKPGNILFDEHGDAKITDFGLSKIVDAPDPAGSMELTSQGAGTYWYLPPECLDFDKATRISNKVDVWSIGVIYYQMLFGKRPYGNGLSQDQVLAERTILKARDGPTFPDQVSSGAKEFITKCLTYEQALRPTVGQLCEHPYVTSKQP